MPNEKGWYTKDEALSTGLPIWIKAGSYKQGKWTTEPYEKAILLTLTRCKKLGMPVLRNGYEAPSAFKYNNAENSSYRYIPLYDRTDVFENGELPYSILNDGEVMGNWEGVGTDETIRKDG